MLLQSDDRESVPDTTQDGLIQENTLYYRRGYKQRGHFFLQGSCGQTITYITKDVASILRKGFFLNLLIKSSNIETPAMKAMIYFLISHCI